jgi:hypothetical protein
MVLANVTVFLLTWGSLGIGKNCKIDSKDLLVFEHVSWVCLALGLVTALIFYLTTKEHEDDVVKRAVIAWRENNESTPLLHPQPSTYLSTKHLNPGKPHMTFKEWITIPQFYMVGAVYISQDVWS